MWLGSGVIPGSAMLGASSMVSAARIAATVSGDVAQRLGGLQAKGPVHRGLGPRVLLLACDTNHRRGQASERGPVSWEVSPLQSAATRRVRLESGIELALYDSGGDGPLVLLHHASGFCAQVWNSLATPLRARFRVVTFDARGHGDSDKPADGYSWDVFADDLARLALILRSEGSPVFAVVGHSLGGTAAWLAAVHHPGLFARIALIDPVLITDAMAVRFAVRAPGSPPPASLTTRLRQERFGSRQEAFSTFRRQALYARFSDQALNDYVEGGLRVTPDGHVELKCPPRIEASIYALGATRGAFEPERVRVATLLLSARDSRFYEAHALVASLTPSLRLETVGGGHLMPMEEPGKTADLIGEFLTVG
jgi:pimeloyl-ACP methyl ester carboxylesterase